MLGPVDIFIADIKQMKNISSKQDMESTLVEILKTIRLSLSELKIPDVRIQVIEFTLNGVLENIKKQSDVDINTILTDNKTLLEITNDAYLEEHFQMQTQLRQHPTISKKGKSTDDTELDWDDVTDDVRAAKNEIERARINQIIAVKFPQDKLSVANYFGALDNIEKSILALTNPDKHLIVKTDKKSSDDWSSETDLDLSEVDISVFSSRTNSSYHSTPPRSVSSPQEETANTSEDEDWDKDFATEEIIPSLTHSFKTLLKVKEEPKENIPVNKVGSQPDDKNKIKPT